MSPPGTAHSDQSQHVHTSDCGYQSEGLLWVQKCVFWCCTSKGSLCDCSRDCDAWKARRREKSSERDAEFWGDPSHWEEWMAQPAEILERKSLPAASQAHGEDLQHARTHLQVEGSLKLKTFFSMFVCLPNILSVSLCDCNREKLGTLSSVNIMLPSDVSELFKSEGLHPRRMTLQPWATHREIRNHSKGIFLKSVPHVCFKLLVKWWCASVQAVTRWRLLSPPWVKSHYSTD